MTSALWFPINLLQLVFTLSWSMACITLALLARLATGSTRPGFWMARWLWAPPLLFFGPFPQRVRGAEKVDWSRPCVVVSNHQSFLDIPLLFRALPTPLHFVVKSELRSVPFLGWYIRAMEMIFVDRSNPEAARLSIERTADALRSGKSVLLFPEGTRSRDGRVGGFKAGMLAAAIASSAPLVPVAVEGPGRAMPRGWPRFRPTRLRVAVGEPIPTEDAAPKDRRALAARVHQEVLRLHGELVSGAE
ncbi:MAG: lysophospholipid acyltransferase family protein [Acidobacteriota bacterium]